MADRWIHAGGSVSTLVSDAAAFAGQVTRVRDPDGWEACIFRLFAAHAALGTFPTRAAAMRAVAGACDPKKGGR